MPEFLSPKARLLLFTVIVIFILTLVLELLDVQIYLAGPFSRIFLATVIAVAICVVLERISEKISHN